MTKFDNPVFATQMRLVHRAGILGPVLVAALIGISPLAGLLYSVAVPGAFLFLTFHEAGWMTYYALFAVEFLVFVLGGFSRISRALSNERKAGLWDSNRLTPLKPSQLVIGYWLGTPLREFYMAAVLALLGLVMVVLAGLPLTLWLETQGLLFATGVIFGLLAVMVGLVLTQPQAGAVCLLLITLFQLFSLSQSRMIITNYLLPIDPILNAFNAFHSESHQAVFPRFFGVAVHPVLYCIALQFVVGGFLWRSLVRKTTDSFQPLFRGIDAAMLFGVLMLAQFGLVSSLWKGQPQTAGSLDPAVLTIANAHLGMLLAGALLLAVASPLPERVRREALRTGFRDLRGVFHRSAAVLGFLFALAAAAVLMTQCLFSHNLSWAAWWVAAGNGLAVFLIVPLLIEFCRLRFQQAAVGFFALGLFILCLLPFVFAAVFSKSNVSRLSLLSPGVLALGEPSDETIRMLVLPTVAHLVIAFILFILWRNQWRRLLDGIHPDTLNGRARSPLRAGTNGAAVGRRALPGV